MRIDDQTSPAIREIWIRSGAIYSDDIGLILNGARLQKDDPVLNALDRPTRDYGEQLRLAMDRGPKQFWKTKVIADKRRYQAVLPVEDHDFLTRFVMLRFAAEAEGLAFAVAGDFLPLRRKDHRLVATAPVIGCANQAAHEKNPKVACEPGEEGRRSSVLANGRLGVVRYVHGKAGGEHLRKDHQ